MFRRSFFKWVFGSVAGLFASKGVQRAEANESEEKCQRVFRWVEDDTGSFQGSGWREIEWEEMKTGDEVIILQDPGKGFNLKINRWKIVSKVNQTPSIVQIDDKATEDLTPEPTGTLMTLDVICRAIKRLGKSHTKELGSTLMLYGKADDTVKSIRNADSGEFVIRVLDMDCHSLEPPNSQKFWFDNGEIATWKPE